MLGGREAKRSPDTNQKVLADARAIGDFLGGIAPAEHPFDWQQHEPVFRHCRLELLERDATVEQALQQVLARFAIFALEPLEQALGGEVDLFLVGCHARIFSDTAGRRPRECSHPGGVRASRAECLSEQMIVLGIDPGTASTGYGVVCSEGSRLRALDSGVIVTRAGVATERRLADIHLSVGELLDRHRPDALAMEELYFGANVRTAFAVGQARGVVLLAAGQRSVPSHSYTPQQVKAAVCGHGGADKQQVANMVSRLLGLATPPRARPRRGRARGRICECNRAPLARALSSAGVGR